MKSKIKYLAIFLSVALLGYGIYFFTYSPPVPDAQTEMHMTYNVEEENDWLYFPGNKDSNTAIIIYQGARVDAKSYSNLANDLQEFGYHVFVSKMPFNWAFLNSSLVDEIVNHYSNIKNFYVGGHSIGGVIISDYVYNHEDSKIKGLFFLASYSAKDFSQKNIPMLGIFGELDGLVTQTKRDEYLSKVSNSEYNEFVIIEGANHAQFGMYGKQDRDIEATISAILQQQITADKINEWIQKISG